MYGVTRILFLHTVFSFLTPPFDILSSWEVPEHMFKHDEKVTNCAQLGCHSFRSYSYIPRYTIMRNEVFVYLEIYSVYLEIFDYGVLVQGVRFPDGTTFQVTSNLWSTQIPGPQGPGPPTRQAVTLYYVQTRLSQCMDHDTIPGV